MLTILMVRAQKQVQNIIDKSQTVLQKSLNCYKQTVSGDRDCKSTFREVSDIIRNTHVISYLWKEDPFKWSRKFSETVSYTYF